MWRVTHIGFGMVDDHEYAYLMGDRGELTLGQIISIYPQLEPGQFGNTYRYRPTYYAMRMLEVWAFRDSAPLYLLLRVLFAMAFCAGVYRIARTWFPRWYALTTSIAILALPVWSQIWYDLGAAEVYGITALPWIVFFAVRWMILPLDRPIRYAYLYGGALLSVVVIGTKENFIFLPAMYGVCALWAWVRRDRGGMIAAAVCLLATLVSSAVIVAAVFPLMAKRGMDQIGKPTGAGIKMGYAMQYCASGIGVVLLTTGVSSLAAMVWMRLSLLSEHMHDRKNLLLGAALGLGIMLPLVSVSQYAIYSGELPSHVRYNFPYILGSAFLGMLFIPGLAVSLLDRHGARSWLVLAIMSISLVACMMRSPWQSYTQGVDNRLATARGQAENIVCAARLAKQNPSSVIIIVLSEYGLYESAVAAERYLRARGVQNKIHLARDSKATKDEPRWRELQNSFFFDPIDADGSLDESEIAKRSQLEGSVVLRLREISVDVNPSVIGMIADVQCGDHVETWYKNHDYFLADVSSPVTFRIMAGKSTSSVSIFFPVAYQGKESAVEVSTKQRISLVQDSMKDVLVRSAGSSPRALVPFPSTEEVALPRALLPSTKEQRGFVVKMDLLKGLNNITVRPVMPQAGLRVGRPIISIANIQSAPHAPH